MSIPLFVDGETELDAVTLNRLVNATNGITDGSVPIAPLETMRQGICNVLDYGATGDGVTDDSLAIQAAIDAAGLAGGGTVWFPGNRTYLCGVRETSTNLDWSLSCWQDDITFAGGPGAVLLTDGQYSLFHLGGAMKPGDPADWLTYWVQDHTTSTYYTINNADRYATTITCTTAADAANFAAGDAIFIRTGQLNIVANTEPDSEINYVVSANAGTGVLTLRYPLCKPYAPENYPVGHADAGNPTAFGVTKITDRMQYNVAFENLTFRQINNDSYHTMFIGWQIDGFDFTNCHFESDTALMNMNVFRNFTWRNLTGWINGTPSVENWWLATGIGCSDGVIDNIEFGGDAGDCAMHIQATSRLICTNWRLTRGTVGVIDIPLIWATARNYAIQFLNMDLVAPGAGGFGIYVGQDCDGGGIIDNVRIHTDGGVAIGIACANWHLGTHQVSGSVTLYNDADGLPITGGAASTQIQVISNWVTDATQSVIIGTIPANSMVQNVQFYIHQDFNAGAGDMLSLGYGSGGSEYAFIVQQDISTVGNKTLTWTAGLPFLDTEREIVATYDNGGAEPTTGKALVVVTFARVAGIVA